MAKSERYTAALIITTNGSQQSISLIPDGSPITAVEVGLRKL